MPKQEPMTGLQEEKPELNRAFTVVETIEGGVTFLSETIIDGKKYSIELFSACDLIGTLELAKMGILSGTKVKDES